LKNYENTIVIQIIKRMDTEKIKKAFDYFEDDDFLSSKELLQQEIKAAKKEYIKKKLGLKNYITEKYLY